MNYKRIAAALAAVAIIASSSYSVADKLIFNDVVTVSAASSLRRNSTGSAVTSLQNNLIALKYLKSGSATGKYDAATESAVKRFQTDYNLTADGVAGTRTVSLLEGIVNGTAKVFEVKSNLLNVRKSPSTGGVIITTIKKGQRFQVEDETTDSDGTKWYKITTSSGQGYVCSEYVVLNDYSTQRVEKVDESAKKGIIKVTGSVLNVRKSPSTTSAKLYTIKMGQTYYFTDMKTVNGDKWYYIKVNKKVSGWILGKWAVPIETESELKDVPKSGKLKVVVDILQVRSSPSTDSKRLYTTKLGEEYSYSNVKRINNVDWYYIKVNNSISGWVLGTMVQAVPNGTSSTTASTNGAAQSTTSSDPNGGTVKVTVDQLNVRESASTSSKKLFVAKKDQVYSYSKVTKVENTDWYYIKVNNSISGWVMGTYVKATPNATQSSSESTSPAQTVSNTLTVVADALNVRQSTSTSSKKVAVVKSGERYTYSKTQNVDNETWYYIKVSNSVSGWVMGKYVKPDTVTTESTKPTSSGDAQVSGKLTVSANLLNVRSEAGAGSQIVTTVKKDASYVFTDVKTVDNEKWYYITVSNSVKGWVNGKYVTVTENTEITTTTTELPTSTTSAVKSETDASTTTTTASTKSDGEKKKYVVIEAVLLNVRSEPSFTSTIIGTVKKDKVCEYTETRTAEDVVWYYIKVSDVRWGWVMGTYVRAVDESKVPTTPKNGSLTVNASVVNVRTGAGTNYEKIGTVKKGEKYQYTDVKDGWYRIVLSADKLGWIQGSYVLTASSTTTTAEKPTTASTEETTTEKTTVTTKPVADEPQGEYVGTVSVTGTLNIRKGAGTNYPVIGNVKNGTQLVIVEKGSEWHKVKFGDDYGYVMASYIKDITALTTAASTTASTTASETTETSSTETSAPESTTTQNEPVTTGIPASPTAAATVNKTVTVGTVKISSNTLTVRSGPGTNYAKIGAVRNGSTVVIVSRGSSWHLIEYGTGTGYVSASYIKNITSRTEAIDMSYAEDYYYINVGQSINLGRNVSGSTVTYTSSDQGKCPVTRDGVASGVKEGLYNIKAVCGSQTASVYVVVLKEPYSDVKTFKISDKGAKFIADWEGGDTILPNGSKVFYPYQDVSGFWTLGYGLAKTSTASKSWTEEQAIAEFNKDIESLIGAEYILTEKRPYLTEEAAAKLLYSDLNNGDYVKSINDWAVRNGVKLNQAQFDALVSFCYNNGTALWNSDSSKCYLKSAILSHRSGSDAVPEQIINGFCLYYKSSGNAYKGLWYRRRNEAELFLTGDYNIDRENKFTLPDGISWS